MGIVRIAGEIRCPSFGDSMTGAHSLVTNRTGYGNTETNGRVMPTLQQNHEPLIAFVIVVLILQNMKLIVFSNSIELSTNIVR